MAKHIGIVACSAEGAALCYTTICVEAGAVMGEHMHPEISMHTYPLGLYTPYFPSGNWEEVGRLMMGSAEKLATIGAEFAICPDNTIHQAFEYLADSPIPWLHIARVVSENAQGQGLHRLGILGTKYLMTGPVYPEMTEEFGISCEIPDESDRETIDRIIFTELVNGIIKPESRTFFTTVIEKLKDRGCDGVVLGCTEIPLIVRPEDSPLPTLDSTRLLAKAAVKYALA